MELSQMIVQATTSQSSPLMQLPHFTQATVEKAKKMKSEDIFDVMNMEDDERTKLLDGLSQSQLMDVARACNRFPCISLEYKVQNAESLAPGASARIVVKLGRDTMEEGETLGPVYAPYYSKEKEEILQLGAALHSLQSESEMLQQQLSGVVSKRPSAAPQNHTVARQCRLRTV